MIVLISFTPAKIVTTGGLAPHVVPQCRGDLTLDADLTFRGTRRAHIWWRTGRDHMFSDDG